MAALQGANRVKPLDRTASCSQSKDHLPSSLNLPAGQSHLCSSTAFCSQEAIGVQEPDEFRAVHA